MILLVNPPFSYGPLESTSPRCPPLGLAYIASYLENFGHKVKILDAFALNLNMKEIAEQIKRNKPEIVGITGTTSNFENIMNIASLVKSIDDNTKVIVGGPHASIMPETCFINNTIDYAVIGEGEIIAKELIDKIYSGGNVKDVKGIVFKSNGKIIKTQNHEMIKNIDSLPLPAYHLLPMKYYRPYATFDVGRRFSSMITSRGCPFSCTFCSSSAMFGHIYRTRSPKRVIEEIELLYEKYKIRHIYFQDDEFTLSNERTKKICDMINERKLDIIWECLSRVDNISKDLLVKMKKSGCVSIIYGVESGCLKTLKKIKKQISLKQAKNACKYTKNLGIQTKVSFIIGFPWESMRDIKDTIEFAKGLNADIAYFNVLTPYPNTEIYNDIKRMGLLSEFDWYKFSSHSKMPLVRTKYLTKEELTKWIGRAYLNFYLRPRFLFRNVLAFRNGINLKRNIKAGIELFNLNLSRLIT